MIQFKARIITPVESLKGCVGLGRFQRRGQLPKKEMPFFARQLTFLAKKGIKF
ncbi:MAG: hypothetical protein PVF37_10570 [Desulfobacterales bacterium]|jgi:hypothetical protein